jgi:RimJ/RimL family protein N-acetyltransferase
MAQPSAEWPLVPNGTSLTGPRIEVRPFGPTDLTDEYIGWLNDPEVMRFSNQRFRTHDRVSCERYLASFAGTDNLFLSVRLHDGRAIGTMTVYASRPHGTADVGIMIGDRACWGRGFGQEAWSLVVDWLARHPAIRKVTAGAAAPNAGMVRLMERSGMTLEAVRRAQEIIGGAPADLVYYARFHDV